MHRSRIAIGVVTVLVVATAGLVVWRGTAGGNATPDPAARPGQVWAVGDGADGGTAERAVASRIDAAGPDRLIYLGDVYETGSPKDFEKNFAEVYGDLVKRMWPTPGNHDWPEHAKGYGPFWAHAVGHPVPDYYTRSIAGWQVISLNSEEPSGPGSPQMRWLQGQLQAPGTCRIAFWHRPRFNAGRHGDQPDLQPLWDAVKGHVALVLNGHDHDMQRLKPIDGITEIVSGAGGHAPYKLNKADPRLAFSNDDRFGALKMILRPGRADLAFVASDGTVLDRDTVGCRER